MPGRLLRRLVGRCAMSLLGVCFAVLAVGDEPPAVPSTTASTINSYESRATSRREAQLVSGGGSAESERAVAAAINWIARHQNPDGSWGCQKCVERCKDETCKAHGQKAGADYFAAATAFGVLPFLAAGQTHETKGPYQAVVHRGLLWLAKNQDSKTGRLGNGNLYEHGLATMALCEAYGVSRDPKLKVPAQAAIAFLEDAQNDETGGWHYTANPPTGGDTSVLGWQVMALRSGQLAGLQVNPKVRLKSKLFLKSVSKGKSGGLFSYVPESGPAPAMTAVGALCRQHGGCEANAPEMTEGLSYIAANQNAALHNTYLLYYATQAMHNLPGQQWEKWNRGIQEALVESQIREGCAAGSWKPNSHDAGPLMSTSLTALTLEVYYRWNPLYGAEPKAP